ncbi:MAG: hypothetical protein IJV02_01620, partial [Candidatus Methanomethylophilaceae archaeon]|nr:hypothetical protein [Candidatus Methanomethylophilaceae archaeon]
MWNRRAEEEQDAHVKHTISISTDPITKEELDKYLWERSVDILPYRIPDDTPAMSFDEAIGKIG